jgi:hypothetical protein
MLCIPIAISVRKAVLGMMAMHRLQDSASRKEDPEKVEKARMKDELAEYKREAEQASQFNLPTRGITLTPQAKSRRKTSKRSWIRALKDRFDLYRGIDKTVFLHCVFA